MAELEEVSVTHRAVEPQRRGVGAVAVVELERAVERKLVLDVQVDVHGAGLHALAQDRCDAAVGKAVEGDDFLFDLLHVRNAALGKRRGVALDLAGQEPARAVHPQAADFALDDFQPDDPAARVLLGDDHGDGLIALVVIGFFQGDARLLDVVGRARRAEIRIDGFLDFELFQALRPVDAVFADVEGEGFLGV